jgi:hypothetical protein
MIRKSLYRHVFAILGIIAFTATSIQGATHMDGVGVIAGSFLFRSHLRVLAAFLLFSGIALALSVAADVIRMRRQLGRFAFWWLPSLLTITLMGSIVVVYASQTESAYHWLITPVLLAVILAVGSILELLVRRAASRLELSGRVSDSIDPEIVSLAVSGRPLLYRENAYPDLDAAFLFGAWIVLFVAVLYYFGWCRLLIPDLYMFDALLWAVIACFAYQVLKRLRGTSVTVTPDSVNISDRCLGFSHVSIPVSEIISVTCGSIGHLENSGAWKMPLLERHLKRWDSRQVFGCGLRFGVKITTATDGQYLIASNNPEKLTSVLRSIWDASVKRDRARIETPSFGLKAEANRKAAADQLIWLVIVVSYIITSKSPIELFLYRSTLAMVALWIIRGLLAFEYPETFGKIRKDVFWAIGLTICAAITTYFISISGRGTFSSDIHSLLDDYSLWTVAIVLFSRVTLRKAVGEGTGDIVLAVVSIVISSLIAIVISTFGGVWTGLSRLCAVAVALTLSYSSFVLAALAENRLMIASSRDLRGTFKHLAFATVICGVTTYLAYLCKGSLVLLDDYLVFGMWGLLTWRLGEMVWRLWEWHRDESRRAHLL